MENRKGDGNRRRHPCPPPPAPLCDDQLPLISQVGRGLRGDSYRVSIKHDSKNETYLEGATFDAASKTWTTDWVSENINGGELMYQYNLRPYTSPQTFTITFRLVRPGRPEWTWTTPAIPYIWDADDDGTADVDGIVGVGVGDLFLKKTTEAEWNYPTVTSSQYKAGELTSDKHGKLVYPDGWTREQFNSPNPGDPWSVNLQYGIGGDLDAPNVDDIAKIIGVSVEKIRDIIQHSPIPDATFPDANLKEYIDRRDREDKEHIHKDLGFGGAGTGSTNFPEDGGSSGNWSHPIKKDKGSTDGDTPSAETTVKGYVDEGDEILRDRIKALEDALDKANDALDKANQKWALAISGILNKIYGGGTMNPDTGEITWPDTNKIPVGNINVLSSGRGNAILTHDGDAYGDLKGE